MNRIIWGILAVLVSAYAWGAAPPVGTGTTNKPAAHAASHASGGSDPLTLTQGQVTGLTAALAGKQNTLANAAALTSITSSGDGTLCLKNNGTYGACGGGGDVSGKLDATTFNSYTSAGGGRATVRNLETAEASGQTLLRVGSWSDLHGQLAEGFPGLTNVIDDINANVPVDLIVSGGDNGKDSASRIEDQSETGAWIAANVTSKGILFRSAAGNHDENAATYTLDQLQTAFISAYGPGSIDQTDLSNTFSWNNVNFITLGGAVTGTYPSDEALDYLEAELRKHDGENNIVISHYPPLDSGLNSSVSDISLYYATNGARMKSICAAYNIPLWEVGHLHYKAFGGTVADVLVSTPSGYGSTTFVGIPSTRAKAWVYYELNKGSRTLTVKFRNSLDHVWIDSLQTTVTLPYMIGPSKGVVGPSATVTDNAVVRFDGTTGQRVQGSMTTLSDDSIMTMTSNPAYPATIPQLKIVNTGDAPTGTNSGYSQIYLQSYIGNASSGSTILRGGLAEGTSSSPAAIGNNRALFSIQGLGHTGSAFTGGGKWEARTGEAWSSGHYCTDQIWYNSNTTTTQDELLRLKCGGSLLLGTTSNPNNSKMVVNGTLEATALKGDGSLITGLAAATGTANSVQTTDGSGHFASGDLTYNGTLTVGGDVSFDDTIRVAVKRNNGTVVSYLYGNGDIYSSGKVAVGTTSPVANVDIKGTASASPVLMVRDILNSNNAGATLSLLHNNDDTSTVPNAGDVLGGIAAGYYDTVGAIKYVATIKALADTGTATGNSNRHGAWTFSTANASGPVERLRLSTDGGMKLASATEQTCDSTHRGTFNYVAGGAGVKDTVKVCAKDSGDAYAWRTIY